MVKPKIIEGTMTIPGCVFDKEQCPGLGPRSALSTKVAKGAQGCLRSEAG